MKHGLGSISVVVNRVLDDLLPDPPYQQDLYVKKWIDNFSRSAFKVGDWMFKLALLRNR